MIASMVCTWSKGRKWLEAKSQGLFWLPKDQYLGHTTTSKTSTYFLIGSWLNLDSKVYLTRSLWDLLGHYGFYLAIMVCSSTTIK